MRCGIAAGLVGGLLSSTLVQAQMPLKPVPTMPAEPKAGVGPVPHHIVPLGVACTAATDDSVEAAGGPEYNEYTITRPPELLKVGKRRYPSGLERQGIGGRVQFTFVIDTLGHPEPCSFHVLSATNTSFEVAAFWMVLGNLFRPGERGGAKVRVRVKQSVTFNP